MCRECHELCQHDLRGLSKHEINLHYFEFIRNATREEREEHGWDSSNTRGLYKCKICGKEHFYKKTSFKVELKVCENHCNGFGECRGMVVVGFNNLAITDPSKIEMLVNKDDGYKFSRKSSTSVLIKCPTCGAIRESSVSNLVRSDGKCKSCVTKEHMTNMTEEERKERSRKLSKATKQFMSNLTEEELTERINKAKNTIANRTDEEKKEISRKRSESAKSFWVNLTEEDMVKLKKQRTNQMFDRWNSMTDEERKQFSLHMSECRLAKTGGISEITTHFRNCKVVQDWKNRAREEANYRCDITNKQGQLPIHHLYGFNLIIRDAHIINNIEVKKTVGEYSQEQLLKLTEYVEKWHEDTSNAVVLSEDIHILFHKEYGKGENTPQQYEEFKQRYLNGEFGDIVGSN